MTGGGNGPIGWTARRIADEVRSGALKPTDVVRAHLEQIDALDGRVGAFQVVRGEKALEEAEEVAAREDLADLPLAGVPIGIKDNIPVAGEPMRDGSAATSDAPRAEDHAIVERLRAAGAVVLGITRMPEFGLWATTDGAFGTCRNPWDVSRSPGGSSGGSAAAVASAMLPVAHGNDGLGSIRIPAACCGVLGIKPSSGVLPMEEGQNDWFGLAENGPIATDVDDAALLLAVMADRPQLAEVSLPDRPLRIALSTRSPLVTSRVDREYAAAVPAMARLLAAHGHRVVRADPPYSTRAAVAIINRWFTTLLRDAVDVDISEVERRTLGHARAGLVLSHLIRVNEEHRERWQRAVGRFFEEFDVLITPALARTPLPADRWSRRGWLANLIANTGFAPFTASWNFAGYPAAAVPAGRHSDGLPVAVQVVSAAGNEALMLSVAKQLEALRPWPRHAPMSGV